ncbi:ankyrin repeat domain-containing protein 39 [Nylanderia fulva]|uniref:ankyrin repeat domain-containing protein 39 n=1 Tax=Nylanderia fulva TaxID=613905 RepID=UPI0010FB61DA|nr:ankyrin repeat domain-containing protein 39 [Nylanderia fulva]XP_029157446.1 ankyrin repeat domain-containing protein 39 [Nylanderia fulva]
MAHSHNDTHACCQTNSSVHQTLDEMVFERGLWRAALEGDVERVEMLLKRGHDARAEDSAGYTPLHYAARNGHYRVCEILLQHGADVDATTPSLKSTSLHRAAIQGHAATVETLLRHGANANLRDTDGKTALHRAISEHASSVETLQNSQFSNICTLLLPRTDLNIKDNSGQTPKELISEAYNETLNKFQEDVVKSSFFGTTWITQKEKMENTLNELNSNLLLSDEEDQLVQTS